MAAFTGQGNTGDAMGTAYAVKAIADVGTSVASASATRSSGDFAKAVADSNARLADIAGADAIRRGETAAYRTRLRGTAVIGAQRAAYASQNVDVNKGSAAKAQEDTASLSALDALTIRNNAAREALGYQIQGLDYSMRGEFADLTARSEAGQTILTGGMKAVSSGLEAGYWFSK
jgi:hypothetical protein